MGEDGEGEGYGEGTKGVAKEEEGRYSQETCVDLDVDGTGRALSSTLGASDVVSLVVSA